ncbi:hypothetical protein SCOR_03255 [Sulfidibacter corallicola]|uniref:Uncharacterized protein n=1 Tax=Sulfidibacter corallicola TaxID=2818388 RepID=A0A8A4TGZ8_SULCO|nr:hypothetical protein [Sulfidibacter corallicola]QTD48452.1 hypothetical protein J3U87_22970 [Sulfidibacter corallicola]
MKGATDNPRLNTFLDILNTNGLIQITPEIIQKAKEHCDYDDDDTLCFDDLLVDLLDERTFLWGWEVFEGVEDYGHALEKVAGVVPGFYASHVRVSFDETEKLVRLDFKQGGGWKRWRFKHYHGVQSENFLTHLELELATNHAYTLFVGDCEEYVALVCLPIAVKDQLVAAKLLENTEEF